MRLHGFGMGQCILSLNQIVSHKFDVCYRPQDSVYEAKVREERAAPVEPVAAAAPEEDAEEASAPEPSTALVLHSSSGSMQPIRRPAAPKSKFTFSSAKKFTPEDSVVTVSVLPLHFHLPPPPSPPTCIWSFTLPSPLLCSPPTGCPASLAWATSATPAT